MYPSSIHSRALALATSGLFWMSAWTTSIARPSSVPPKSSTAISTAAFAPGPPMFRYGPATSLSSPILTGAELVCARMTLGRASSAPAATVSAVRRVIVLFTLWSSPRFCR